MNTLVGPDNTTVQLEPKAMAVLVYLAEHSGEVSLKERIIQSVWPDTFVTDDVLKRAISDLRKALKDDASNPTFIQTITKRGYRLVAQVTQLPDQGTPGKRLDSWKEIAVYLKRDVRTVQRWEKREGLPVHRHLHDSQATVYAQTSELDVWTNARRPIAEEPKQERAQSKNYLWWVVAAAGLIIGIALGTWWMRPTPFAFEEHDWVLVTAFENQTQNPLLGDVMRGILERELANTHYIRIVSPERIQDTLRLMEKPLDTVVASNIGREVCLRDGGIRALLTGSIQTIGSTYLLSVDIVNPAQGNTVASSSVEAADENQLLPAIRGLSIWARERFGESRLDIQQSQEALEKVTTPSFRALELYTQGMVAVNLIRWPEAEQLLRDAIAEDPTRTHALHLKRW
jgi:DNA-binding winged helix-turn-helix (wHTH) protein